MNRHLLILLLSLAASIPAQEKQILDAMSPGAKDRTRFATPITAGTAVPFTLPSVNLTTIFASQYSYSIEIPSGVTTAVFELRTLTPNFDMDLYVRRNADVGLIGTRPNADYIAETLSGDETISINSPVAGTYYIGFGSFTLGVSPSATIRVVLNGGNTGGGNTGNYNGSWTGTTNQGQPITFTVSNNVVTQLTYTANWSLNITCPSSTTVNSTPNLAIAAASFANNRITGTFSSDTAAAGTLTPVLSINGPTQFCNQTLNLTWTASRGGGGNQPPSYAIGGTVTDNGGIPVSGVTLSLAGGATQSLTTLAAGTFQFGGLTSGLNYTLTPSKTGCTFSPPLRSYSPLSSAQTSANFTATCQTAGGSGYSFFPVTPCRVVDTRAGEGKTGAFGPPRPSGGSTREVPLPQSGCGVPSTAKAYSLNYTVIPAGILSYLTTWPAGQAQPVVSTLNSFHGGVVANAAIVPAGNNGAINIFVTEAADVIVDINGYFDTPGANTLDFFTVTPCRVADTRSAPFPLGLPALAGGATRNFPLLAGSCSLPATARAYSLNATVVPSGTLGYLTLFPAGAARPLASTLNSFDGVVVANAALVPAGTGGDISAFVTHSTELILDTNGYFAPPGSSSLKFYPVTPCRIADTRAGQGPILTGGTTRNFPVAGNCNIPANAQAYSLNATVVPNGSLAYLTLWPTGQAQPVVSTLNSFQGRVLANAAIVPAGSGGSVSAYVTNATHLVLDVNGYFAP